MKRLFVLLPMVLLMACESERTIEGESDPVQCYGFNSMDTKDSTVVYKLSARNLVVGIFFSGLIVPPVVVALDEVWCPVKRKPLPTPVKKVN